MRFLRPYDSMKQYLAVQPKKAVHNTQRDSRNTSGIHKERSCEEALVSAGWPKAAESTQV